MRIPDNYVEEKFFEHVGFPVKRGNGDMVGCCPFCMEGNSWGKKKRFNYFSDKQALVCFNCGETHNAISFLKKVDNIDFHQLMKNIGEDEFDFISSKKTYINITEPKPDFKLPKDYINVFDKAQQEFYKDEYFFALILKEVKRRRLDTAVNIGELWVSLDDWLHKNRIIIPFFDETGELLFYQSRAMTKKQEEEYGKYISCLNGDKILYGLDRIDTSTSNIFFIEGPLDCFFVKNSFGGGGIKLNSSQLDSFDTLAMIYNIVICLDNDFDNAEVVELYEKYIKDGLQVFMWGGNFSDYKDFNQYCIDNECDEVTEEQILEFTYTGGEAIDMLELKVKEVETKKAAIKNNGSSYFDYGNLFSV